MRPILFHIGPVPVYGFGLMMALAFLTANYLFTRELKRRWRNEEHANNTASAITLIALIAGVAGSKIFDLAENPRLLLTDPISAIFSGSGLTFYGGLLLAMLSIYVWIKKKKLRFLEIADVAAPALILAYGIGRIGCQLAGDGDYGIPSSLPWAMGYPQGTVSTLSRMNPELSAKFLEMHPGTPLPADIMVHPTPVYETLSCIAVFALLMMLRNSKAAQQTGYLFGVYLICAAIERFLVEFIRLNHLYGGLSEAQWISVGLFIAGILRLVLSRRNSAPTLA